jgi:hypothetical protein
MKKMDDETLHNWCKIKTHLEQVGKTDNMFYKRAVSITSAQKDPLPEIDWSSS